MQDHHNCTLFLNQQSSTKQDNCIIEKEAKRWDPSLVWKISTLIRCSTKPWCEIYWEAMGGRIAREISHRKGMKSGFVGALACSSPQIGRMMKCAQERTAARKEIMRCINSVQNANCFLEIYDIGEAAAACLSRFLLLRSNTETATKTIVIGLLYGSWVDSRVKWWCRAKRHSFKSRIPWNSGEEMAVDTLARVIPINRFVRPAKWSVGSHQGSDNLSGESCPHSIENKKSRSDEVWESFLSAKWPYYSLELCCLHQQYRFREELPWPR